MIKAVIFDLDDTLYAYEALDKKARANVENFTCHELDITKEQYREAYLFGRQETKKRLSDVGAGHNRLLYCQKTLEYLGIPPMPLSLQMYEKYWGIFLQEMKLFPGVRELFDDLNKRQIPIMICTDLTAHIQHRKIEALGITSYIKYLVSSEEAGKEKPAHEIFDLCLEKLKLLPQEVWYVGDSFKKDIKGAMQAGMQAVWFHPQDLFGESSQADLSVLGVSEDSYIKIQDYGQLREILAAETGEYK